MRKLIVLLALLFALACAGFSDGGDAAKASNYNGWEAGDGAIMCDSAHNGLVINQSGTNYRCGFAYDPGAGLYFPGWGFVASCRTGSPYYGYCWRWNT